MPKLSRPWTHSNATVPTLELTQLLELRSTPNFALLLLSLNTIVFSAHSSRCCRRVAVLSSSEFISVAIGGNRFACRSRRRLHFLFFRRLTLTPSASLPLLGSVCVTLVLRPRRLILPQFMQVLSEPKNALSKQYKKLFSMNNVKGDVVESELQDEEQEMT
ncbi:hypothetical protein PIB30_075838 [Stylosanthes scabra]|uniref:Uncharacterized protein n=1 Tax=Stylosanthes scabra TaxID=79078 RepID=A0ABU6YQL2_9FABA|nr:hypothetical protein [Stylosanthes scabra]